MANDERSYEVGYGKPPKSGQFQKGRSGNPRGRPKGSKGMAAIFQSLMKPAVTIKEGGKTKRVSKLEAIVLQLGNKALGGDLRAMKEFLRLSQAFETPDSGPGIDQPDAEKDRASLHKVLQRMSRLAPPIDIPASEAPEINSLEEADEQPTDR